MQLIDLVTVSRNVSGTRSRLKKRAFLADVLRAAGPAEVGLAVKNARMFDYVVNAYCNLRKGEMSCKGCVRPLKSWTPTRPLPAYSTIG